MYPFKDDNVYLRNSWYVLAFADELDNGPIERIIMDELVALFRVEDGTPVAMAGICPHRRFPLALGRVVGDAIECKYHGFQFDGRTGSCVKIPSQTASPRGFMQQTYPLVQHGEWLWIWPGDPALADRALLPPLATNCLGDGWRVDNVGLLPTAGRAQLMIENLFDLTHVAFLHGANIDGSMMIGFDTETIDDAEGFRDLREARSPWIAGFYDLLFGPELRFEGEHVSLTGSYYHSPGYIRTNSGIIQSIEAFDTVDHSKYGTVVFHHIVTPETKHSCHYFASTSRNFRLKDDGLSAQLSAMERTVRMEDVVAAGLIEERLQKYNMPHPDLLARADTAAVKLRRRMQAELDREANTKQDWQLAAVSAE